MTPHYYWHKMDINMTNNAIKMAEFTESAYNLIFTKERKAFEVF
jgi:hypothetical protein